MGGVGRRNPENADRVSLAIMKAGMRFRELKPEFSLRVYKGLSDEVRDLGLRMLENAASLYTINTTKLLRYAGRRHCREQFEQEFIQLGL